MRHWDLNTSLGRLQQSTAQMLEHWRASKDRWDDATRNEFGEKFITPVRPMVVSVVASLHQLAETLEKARRAVDDPDNTTESVL